jgi:hypothetical protein
VLIFFHNFIIWYNCCTISERSSLFQIQNFAPFDFQVLSVAVYNHYKRIYHASMKGSVHATSVS